MIQTSTVVSRFCVIVSCVADAHSVHPGTPSASATATPSEQHQLLPFLDHVDSRSIPTRREPMSDQVRGVLLGLKTAYFAGMTEMFGLGQQLKDWWP